MSAARVIFSVEVAAGEFAFSRSGGCRSSTCDRFRNFSLIRQTCLAATATTGLQ